MITTIQTVHFKEICQMVLKDSYYPLEVSLIRRPSLLFLLMRISGMRELSVGCI